MLKTRSLILFGIVLILFACASKMSDEVYELISEDFTDEMFVYILETEELEFDEGYEQFVMNKLEEVSKKHGFNADEYLKKAKEKDEGWEDITGRIEERIMEFIKTYWELVEEDSLDVE